MKIGMEEICLQGHIIINNGDVVWEVYLINASNTWIGLDNIEYLKQCLVTSSIY